MAPLSGSDICFPPSLPCDSSSEVWRWWQRLPAHPSLSLHISKMYISISFLQRSVLTIFLRHHNQIETLLTPPLSWLSWKRSPSEFVLRDQHWLCACPYGKGPLQRGKTLIWWGNRFTGSFQITRMMALEFSSTWDWSSEFWSECDFFNPTKAVTTGLPEGVRASVCCGALNSR